MTFLGILNTALRLGFSSGVTNLHPKNTFQGTIFPLHGLCSLPFPQHRRLSFVFALSAMLALSPNHLEPSHPSFTYIFRILLETLLGHSKFSFSFWSLVEIHFSADLEIFIFPAIILLKGSDTIMYVFARTHTCKWGFVISTIGWVWNTWVLASSLLSCSVNTGWNFCRFFSFCSVQAFSQEFSNQVGETDAHRSARNRVVVIIAMLMKAVDIFQVLPVYPVLC